MPDYGGGYSQPAQGAVTMNTGVALANPGRALLIVCTGTGTVTVQFADTSTFVITVQTGTIYQFNWAVTKVTTGTATCTYASLV